MKLLLTSAGVKNASIHDALVDLLGKPIAESSALCIPTAMYGHPKVGPGASAWRFHQRPELREPHERAGVEVGGRAGAHRAAQHRRGALGPAGPGDRRPAGRGRRRAVPVPLDAGVRTGGPPAVADRDGLGGAERREHGDDPPHRRGLRRLEVAQRRRQHARAWSTSRSFRTWLPDVPDNTMANAEKWAAGIDGSRRTRSTTRPPSEWSTATSTSSPKGTGRCSTPEWGRVVGARPSAGVIRRSTRASGR